MKQNSKNAVVCWIYFMILMFTGLSQDSSSSSRNVHPLPIIETSTPRKTLKSFLDALNDFKRGMQEEQEYLISRIHDGIFCLSIEHIPTEKQLIAGKNAARYIKEVIDRVWNGQWEEVPDDPTVLNWRIPGTVFTICKIQEGNRKGEYLFSKETVDFADDTYQRYLHLPYQPWSGQGAFIREEAEKAPTFGEFYVKTDTPRQTMRTFMQAMNDYRNGKEERIEDAVACLDLSKIPAIARTEQGRLAALLLKEVIDRIIVIDYSKIPETLPNGDPILRWRLKNSRNRIVIVRIDEGPRKGEYLFSSETVAGIKEFYNQIKDQPYLPGSGQGANYHEPWLQQKIPAWLQKEYVLLRNWQWIGLFLVILLGYVIHMIILRSLDLIVKFVHRTKNIWDDHFIQATRNPLSWIFAAIAWYIGLHLLHIEGAPLSFFLLTIRILFSIFIIWFLYQFSETIVLFFEQFAQKTENTIDNSLIPLIRKAIRTFVIVFGVLVALQNLGLNVMSILAGLGLGGLAIALAAQDTFANFFGSIMLLTDKPFKVGDVIRVDDIEGTVEQIGFRSTRIRTFEDSIVNIPNAKLANNKIDNRSKRRYRRSILKLGLTYNTPVEHLEAFTEGIKNILKSQPNVRQDYFITAFTEFGDFSLNILLFYFVEVNTYEEEMAIRHTILIQILRLAQQLGVSFAFPTQSLYIEQLPPLGFFPHTLPKNLEELRQTVQSFSPNGANAKYLSPIFIPTIYDPDILAAKAKIQEKKNNAQNSK